MKRQAYQHPELRDATDSIIQDGAFGKKTPLANAEGTGWIDYVANDLEALHDAINGGRVYVANKAALTKPGDVANVYIARDTGKWYYWDPGTSAYVEIDNARNVANDAIAARDMAKAWAQSTSSPDGAADTASPTGKTQSARSWAMYSKDRATAAATSASASANSASEAKTSEGNAASSKTAAATSANNAADSAKAAATSAQAAANSAREQQADWNVTDTTSKAFIKNKPDAVLKSGLASSVSTASLTVTGDTSVPTANEGNSSKAIANTEFVQKSIEKVVGAAPAALDTLQEIGKALNNDADFAGTMTAELAKKLNSAEAESEYATKTEAGVPYQIKRNTAYKVGDVLTSPSLPPGCVIVVTQAGTTGSTEPDWTAIKSNMGG